ncbi:DgyrCDS2891 [Dimorphilus gyrociliatus]|uniref:DgyrCDS2891 n=1 Tax=Dimorphilus gyrociliatus TaxID=2664684 RepID=A0A7I8VC64_9ANNE|nr:DgyrCDS2891 [Dimorphilus gyrociliatus]
MKRGQGESTKMRSFLILGVFCLLTIGQVHGESQPRSCLFTGNENDLCDASNCSEDNDCSNDKVCCANNCGALRCAKPVICEYCPEAEINNCTYGRSEESVNGCRSCKCKEDPCKNMKCESDKCIVYFEDRPFNRVARGKCIPKHLPEKCYKEPEVAAAVIKGPVYYYDVVQEVCLKKEFGPSWHSSSYEGCRQKCNITCPLMKCVPCQYGYKTTVNGCQTCECKRPHRPCKNLVCKMNCISGFKIDRYGCRTCECKTVRGPQFCYEPKVVGVCEPKVLRYHYDPIINRCRPFMFGCNGNRNNFMSYHECESQCTNPGCPVPSCRDSCDHGYSYTPEGCQTCSCAHKHVCDGIMCAENYHCVSVKDCSGKRCRDTFQCQLGSSYPEDTDCKSGWSKRKILYVTIPVVIVVILAAISIVLFIKLKAIHIVKAKIKPQKKNMEKPPIDNSQVVSVDYVYQEKV